MELEAIPKGIQDQRNKIAEFAEILRGMPGITIGDNENCPLKHSFVDGQYIREIFVPANTILVTKIHKQEHPTFMMTGKLLLISGDGTREELIAPAHFITKVGTQRAIHVLEDTIWVDVHSNPDNETDIDKIEEFVIAKTYDELPDITAKELK